jgi:hypothetical protein
MAVQSHGIILLLLPATLRTGSMRYEAMQIRTNKVVAATLQGA